MRSMTRLGLVVTVLITAPAALWAQATGQINGIVTDTSGAVLPGVTIEAANAATSLFKNFDFAGRHRIQARLEAFNVWNQARFLQPNGVIKYSF